MVSIVVSLFLIGIVSQAHPLRHHQWKDRVVVILSDDYEYVNAQMTILKADIAGCNERKLVVYQANSKGYISGFQNEILVLDKGALFGFFGNQKESTTMLIGLDGGIKLKQSKLVQLEEIFGLIDQMPMRNSELKQNK